VHGDTLHLRGRIPSDHAVLGAVTRWLAAVGGGTTGQAELDAIRDRNRASNRALRADLARAAPAGGVAEINPAPA
jgi:hypothetical protein